MRGSLLLLSLLSVHSFASSRPVLTYEPAIVDLVGTLDLQTFPGPPNYESIGDGDELERHFYLKLDSPVDVIPKGDHPKTVNPEVERNVSIVQLSIGSEDGGLWARFRKQGEGAHVKITGTLFHRFTGHHHSRVLLIVKNMEPVSNK